MLFYKGKYRAFNMLNVICSHLTKIGLWIRILLRPFLKNGGFCTETRLVCFLVDQCLFLLVSNSETVFFLTFLISHFWLTDAAFVSLRDHANIPIALTVFRVNQAALRAVLKPENVMCTCYTNTCTLRLYASFGVWITIFARCLNLFQSITKHWSTGAKLFCIWNNCICMLPNFGHYHLLLFFGIAFKGR